MRAEMSGRDAVKRRQLNPAYDKLYFLPQLSQVELELIFLLTKPLLPICLHIHSLLHPRVLVPNRTEMNS